MTLAVVLRAARADDAPRARAWIRAASGGFLRFVFGLGRDELRALDFVEAAFREREGPLSHTYAVVADLDEHAVGMALGFPARDKSRIDRALAPLLWRSYRTWELPRFAINGLRADRFQAGIPEGSFYLSILGVDEACRGRGIGSVLLEDTLARARSAGCATCMLHVSVANDGARRLYERHGFAEFGQCRNETIEERHGIDGQRMMRRRV